jgi:cytochrome c-type biogenesis protein CcmH
MIEPLAMPFVFWLLAAAMTMVALLFVLPRLWRGPRPAATTTCTSMNAAIYRQGLAELDRDHDLGQLTAAQHATARADLERRLLADVQEADPSPAHNGRSRGMAVAIALALPALALALYALFGEPAAVQGDANASALDAAANLATPEMRGELVRHLERNPGDARGWVLLARGDAAADRFGDATLAFERALAASPKVAADAGIWCEYADALGMAQGGRLAGKPRELVMRALSISPAHPRALEMAGSAAYEARDFDAAARYWRQLAAQMPDGSPSQRELIVAIARAERLALMGGPPPSRAQN